MRSIAIALLLSACAAAGAPSNGYSDAPAAPKRDAQYIAGDAPPRPADARAADAYVPPPDAAVDAASALFCSQNSDCTNAGDCCIILGSPPGICGPGTIILGACIPQ